MAFCLVKKHVEYRYRRQRNHIFHAGNFYNISEKLLKDDNISDYMVSSVEFMNHTIDDRNSAGMLLRFLRKNKDEVPVNIKNRREKNVFDKNIGDAEKLKIFIAVKYL